MAYKFQRGKANLSGSITAEEGLKGTLGVDDLDLDGATDIGADLADADLLLRGVLRAYYLAQRSLRVLCRLQISEAFDRPQNGDQDSLCYR